MRYFTPAIFSFVWDCLYLWHCARHQKFFHFIFQAQRQNAINLINVKETVITDTYLMYQTYPQPSPDTEIVYQIITPPKQGVLLLSSSRHMDVLSRGSTGTFISILLLPIILTMCELLINSYRCQITPRIYLHSSWLVIRPFEISSNQHEHQKIIRWHFHL